MQININAKILFKHIGIIILVKKCIWLSGQKERCQHGYNKNRQCLFRKKIIITDLDGTISDCTHRLKYYRKNDYFKFNELGSEDLPITPIVNILRNLQE